MNLAKRAVFELYNGFLDDRDIFLKYSSKFKGFNANVYYTSKYLEFRLSKEWVELGDDLKIGLIQSLCNKVFNTNVLTLEIELYRKFLDNIGSYVKIDKRDSVLEDSFNRINVKYFDGLLTRPNLVWGEKAFTKLGHYEHQSDTVLISSIFKDELYLLDFIMFHELLHKKHGLERTSSGRHVHHSKAFRLEEALYEDKDIERKLRFFVRKKRVKNWFGF